MMGVLIGLGIFLGVVLVYLIIIIFLPILKVKQIPIPVHEEGDQAEAPSSRTDVEFPVDGINISGWLYLPDKQAGPFPCVVLCHGFKVL